MSNPKPFLKWAGGKRRLAKVILDRAGEFNGNYFEPFLGAGAVLFEVSRSKARFVSDANLELINTYKAIRDELDNVIETLHSFKPDKESYLDIRAMDRKPNFAEISPAVRAARFIYLNKVGYNGLHRVNSMGQFNVPFGRNSGNFLDIDNLVAVSNFLQANEAGSGKIHISSSDFVAGTELASAGDFVYLDPPYDAPSDSGGFVAYSRGGFTREDQLRVRDQFLKLVERGVSVIASNADTDFIRDIYKTKGTKIENLSVARPINSNGAGRGKVAELLIQNIAT